MCEQSFHSENILIFRQFNILPGVLSTHGLSGSHGSYQYHHHTSQISMFRQAERTHPSQQKEKAAMLIHAERTTEATTK